MGLLNGIRTSRSGRFVRGWQNSCMRDVPSAWRTCFWTFEVMPKCDLRVIMSASNSWKSLVDTHLKLDSWKKLNLDVSENFAPICSTTSISLSSHIITYHHISSHIITFPHWNCHLRCIASHSALGAAMDGKLRDCPIRKAESNITCWRLYLIT